MASMSKTDSTVTASFVYNAEGLRMQKNVNGVVLMITSIGLLTIYDTRSCQLKILLPKPR